MSRSLSGNEFTGVKIEEANNDLYSNIEKSRNIQFIQGHLIFRMLTSYILYTFLYHNVLYCMRA